MSWVVGYASVLGFAVLIVVILETTTKRAQSFSDYATASRSFGSFFSTMAFVNTWLPGTIFISFAGLAAASGIIGFYVVAYSLIAVVVMAWLAAPVHRWGKRFDLRTQADLLGLRYGSPYVRIVAAVIGVAASFPWVVLGMQSLGLVFRYLSFGQVGAPVALAIGIAFVFARQYWTVRFGMRGVMVSDMVQGIVAYGIGTLAALGIIVWLFGHGHGFTDVPAQDYTLPGPGSALGPLYLASLLVTGAVGGWCWPDIFVRLFTAKSTRSIRRSALQVAPILFVFGSALMLLAVLASTVPGVAAQPDDVWFIVAGAAGGPVLVILAGVCVVAATMGNVGANVQALGTQIANDIVSLAGIRAAARTRSAVVSVGLLAVAGGAAAYATLGISNGLVQLAMLSYQGISQLGPTLFLGIGWKRGNATGAIAGMTSGIVTAGILQLFWPDSIPWLWGMTSGVAALFVNAGVYVACAFLFPHPSSERERVGMLFAIASRRVDDTAAQTLPTTLPDCSDSSAGETDQESETDQERIAVAS